MAEKSRRGYTSNSIPGDDCCPDWMKDVSDHTLLSNLSILGTHASAAIRGFRWATQSWSIKDQLYAGIRFLDIRCYIKDMTLVLYHGFSTQSPTFSCILEKINTFLGNHRGEVIIMRLRRWHRDDEDTFKSLFNEQANQPQFRRRLWLENRIPKVGEVRGKIVLLNDFCRAQTNKGIWWADINAAGQGPVLNRFGIKDKRAVIEQNLLTAKTGRKDDMYVTFTGGCGWGVCHDTVAKNINPRLMKFIEDKKDRYGPTRYGIIAMDFPDTEIIQEIIQCNGGIRNIADGAYHGATDNMPLTPPTEEAPLCELESVV